MNIYESEQIQAIQKWEAEEPSVLTKVSSAAFTPAVWALNKIIPIKVIQGAISAANAMGGALANKDDILRDAGVKSIEELKKLDLETSDKLANEIHNWALGIAGVEGTAAGMVVLPGMVADIPALITLAFRTIHKIGLCYDYECTTEQDKIFVNMIMSAAGANSVKEKAVSLMGLQQMKVLIQKVTFKAMAEKAANDKFSKEFVVIFARSLAKSLGKNLTKRKLLQAIPIVGGVVGGAMNASFIQDVAWAARRAFQKRWLEDNGKISILLKEL